MNLKNEPYAQRFRLVMLEVLLMGRTVKTVELRPRGAIELTFEDGTTTLLKISKGAIVGKEIQQAEAPAPKEPAQVFEPRQCAAVVETRSGRPRIGYTHHKQCQRRAAEQVGHLYLCKAHARLCRQGFVDQQGSIAPKSTISDYRQWPEKFRTPHYDWLPGATPRSE